ncbi:MAG: cation transporter [Candidatus Protochlamydia sp.]|nr:cation transporter [Candidatus Protochlamydia sp.]
MSKFPRPVHLPPDVYAQRANRNRQVIQAAKLGMKIRLAIILFEFVGVVLMQSSALFLDAVSSLMDVMSTLLLIFCMKIAHRPPDENHPFGHGRFEPLGGLLLGLMLVVVGGIMVFQQFLLLFHESIFHQIHPLTWIFPFVAMVLLEISYQIISGTAKKENSPALAADAVHYRIDGISSLFAALALIIGAFFPQWSGLADHAGAILIAVFMVGLGFMAGRDNFNQLVDKVPDPEFFKKVKAAALAVKGVQAIEKVRIQLYGPDAHVDIDIEVNPRLSVDLAHQISQKVRAAIQKDWPAVQDVTVHIEPYYAGDH